MNLKCPDNLNMISYHLYFQYFDPTDIFVFNTIYVYLQCRPSFGCNWDIVDDWHDENLFYLTQQKLEKFQDLIWYLY